MQMLKASGDLSGGVLSADGGCCDLKYHHHKHEKHPRRGNNGTWPPFQIIIFVILVFDLVHAVGLCQ